MPTFETTKWEVEGKRLLELEQAEKDLKKANLLIKRLRAKINVHETQRQEALKLMYHRRRRLKHYSHKYGATVMISTFKKAFL